MTRSAIAILTAAALCASAAIAQTPRDTTTTPGTESRSGANRDTTGTASDRNDATTSRSSDATNRADEKFLKDFVQANAAEVEAGKLASQKAQNADVKAFAKHMVDDHSKTIGKVETVASKYNVDVKAKPDMKHKAKSAMLEQKDGANFDEAYIKSQVKDHEEVVQMLQKQIRDGKDPAVKQLASQALPDVQHHLEMAKQLQAKVSGGKDSSRTSMRDAPSSDKTTTTR
jgi:putative membrane protein